MAEHASRLVIFDCDGVLVDSEPISLGVLVEVLDAAGVSMTTEEASERFLGRSLQSMSAILHDEYGLATDTAFLEAMRMRLYARFRQELKAVPGIRQAVEQLDAACCVASSSQPERIRLSLTVTGLIDLFEPHIFSATMVTHGKPAPDLFLHASAQMGYAPANCIVVEDSPAGIEAAKAAGMRVFAFAGASHARNERHRQALANLDPDVLFDDMGELIQFVRQ
ncbi:hydrolase [Sinorhizobium fredii USDA 205]|uniref:HAD-IA family hydrolase n=1 Tax=Rhizobium fredii TaxID=380 RepID=A0A844ABZ4_RHIFR|nr:HAD family hydrolase [Sinorhizobium fredii]AWM26026.1 Hydrolase in polyol utilization cluster haloacid dehalogenase-like family [Sinorhizobium fredii CCBAU 25509]KSV91736.1 hydrolase [Sinorhizobium fredii USDA 205]MQW99224.1 HAD-IA family hydrolase [Sinorhizobium fredii]MQX09166.1 HAD-IA family hydrolase [Sinorhizobium fredii]UTY50125.1 HAD family hydrolase [Sinorhizobium fredii]